MYARHGRRGLGDTIISGRNAVTVQSTRDPAATPAGTISPSASLTLFGLAQPGAAAPTQYASDAAAAALAKYLGGTVAKDLEYGPNAPAPTNEIVLPSGNVINAGLYQATVAQFGVDRAASMLTAQEVASQKAASQSGQPMMTAQSNPSITPGGSLVYAAPSSSGSGNGSGASTGSSGASSQSSSTGSGSGTQQTASGSYAVTNPITAPEDPYLPTSPYVPLVSSAAATTADVTASVPSWAWWLAAAFGGWYLLEKA